MSAPPSRRRRLEIGVLVAGAFVTGVVVGCVVTSAAASRASQVFLGAASHLFIHDQNRKLAASWKAGDMEEALAYATCSFEASYGDGARAFDPSYLGWNVWGGAISHRLIVEPNSDAFRRARPNDEAISRAHLAVVLERLGRRPEAERQLDEAAKVSGVQDAARWRDIALKTITAVDTGDHR